MTGRDEGRCGNRLPVDHGTLVCGRVRGHFGEHQCTRADGTWTVWGDLPGPAADTPSPVTADVQPELAEALNRGQLEGALLPTVQALIADAEKRAAAGALRNLAVSAPVVRYDTGGYPVRAVPVSELLSAADALDPSGAAEGAGR